MKKPWLSYLIAGMLSQSALPALAFETFVVKDIRIEGLQRITEATVLNYLPLHPGDELGNARTSEILKALFETGFFQDIKLEKAGNILVVKVTERPTIGKINIEGNKDIPKDDLNSTLKSAGLAEGYVFDRATLDQVSNELERLYFSHGKYAVKVETTVEPLDNNRVNVAINIVEGQAARIKEINIVGNQCFDSKTLMKHFTLASTGAFSWVTQSDQYDKQKLGADLESLRTYYLDRGYLNFQIISTQVSITPDKQDIYVTINIQEGEQFTLSHFALAGNTMVPQEELSALINLKEGEIFSRAAIAHIVKCISDRLGQEGFANAKVNPVPELDEVNKTVSLIFYVEPGQRISVRQVRIEGNTKTKDEVIRREIIQTEGSPINTRWVEDSKMRLNRTGFFTDVKIEMRPVMGASDEIDVVYIVEEASAGQLGGAVGYSDLDGLIYNANISNRNFMGSGKNIDLSFNHSKAYTTVSSAYNNPYYTDDGVSRGFNAFFNRTDISKVTDFAQYKTNTVGANAIYGLPLSPYDRLTFGYGYQNIGLVLPPKNTEGMSPEEIQATRMQLNPLEIINFVDTYGTNSNEVTVAVGWMRNTLNRMVFPEEGMQQSASITATAPGSHLEYYRLSYTAQYYQPLYAGFIFMGSGTLGFGGGYGKTNSLPFYKNFMCGGIGTVRGYQPNTLGPRDSKQNPFGGNLMAAGTAALIFPNFFSEEIKTVRFSWFLDAGQVYDTHFLENFGEINGLPTRVSRNPAGFRYSTGFSITWMSPMAPMTFSVGLPLVKKAGDHFEILQFTFGTV